MNFTGNTNHYQSSHSTHSPKTTLSKKIIAIVCIAILLITTIIVISNNHQQSQESLIRIHIRANSNSDQDQAIKLKVRDRVTDYLTKELDGVKTHDQAYERLLQLQDNIQAQSISVLQQNGFLYGAKITINNEYFPTRTYEGIVVESGYYDAVIIELGSGLGDNWWCVVYPPLCFIKQGNSTDFEYKSKLQEWWDKWFGNKK